MGNPIIVLKDLTIQWGLQMCYQVITIDLYWNGGMRGVLRILEAQGGNQEVHAEEMISNGIQKDDAKCVRGNR